MSQLRPTTCTFEVETRLRTSTTGRIPGIDEAGRGPLAGPLVVAAFCFGGEDLAIVPRGLTDSKKLSSKRRDTLYEELLHLPECARAVIVMPPAEVDRLNILEATREGMRRAAMAISDAEHSLLDGLPVPDFPTPHTAIVGGDSKSLSIAAASILAKVTRDRIMEQADDDYPEYGFAQHKGYPTRQHLAMLEKHGPTPIHRFSFAPVAQASLPLG